MIMNLNDNIFNKYYTSVYFCCISYYKKCVDMKTNGNAEYYYNIKSHSLKNILKELN